MQEINLEANRRLLNRAFFILCLALTLYALWFGGFDMYETNWDSNLHMRTMEDSSAFIKRGWVGYGGTYYKVGNIVQALFTPFFWIQNLTGFQTSGTLSALLLANAIFLLTFFYLLFKFFNLNALWLIPLCLLLATSITWHWIMRAYPDVMVTGAIGIGTIFLIVYLVLKKSIWYLIVSAAFLGLALQGKPPAILPIAGLTPLILLSTQKLRDLTIFLAVFLFVFFIFGYPQNLQLIEKQLGNLGCDASSWCGRKKGEFSVAWVRIFLSEYAIVTLLPASLFLLVKSPIIISLKTQLSRFNSIIIFTSLALASLGVVLFLLFNPVKVHTAHYTLIALPAHCLLFLALGPGAMAANRFTFWLTTGVSYLIFITWAFNNPNSFVGVHERKLNEIDCIAVFENFGANLSLSDFSTVYTPRKFAGEYGQLSRATDIMKLVNDGEEHQVLSSRKYLNRFKYLKADTTTNKMQEGEMLLGAFAKLKQPSEIDIGDLTVRLVREDKSCNLLLYSVGPTG